jgi:RNA polymerase sigma-70 factor (ECF subfamily)
MQLDLVLRAQAGDHDAFSALATGSIARMYRTARLILRDDEQARDATQDALVRAWLDIRALRDPGRFEAWLNRILVRGCYEESARNRRRKIVEIRVDAIEMAGELGDGRHLVVRDQLDRGFRRLTAPQRAVLVVHHYLGLPDAEAADMLGIPTGTFKSRLHRATAALREAIEADERGIGEPVETLA